MKKTTRGFDFGTISFVSDSGHLDGTLSISDTTLGTLSSHDRGWLGVSGTLGEIL